MRALPLLGAVIAGLCLCGTAAAQTTSNLYQSNYASSAKTTALFQSTYGTSIAKGQTPAPNTSVPFQSLSGGFSPRTLFDRFQSPTPRDSSAPPPALINPNTDPAGYLAAFGIKRLPGRVGFFHGFPRW
jgi:hypothetical protein